MGEKQANHANHSLVGIPRMFSNHRTSKSKLIGMNG